MNHYQTLGIAPGASEDEIKQAYRKLASKHHPDKGGSTEKFQEVQAAYDALVNKKQPQQNPQTFDDVFSAMFGASIHPGRFHRHLTTQLHITVEDSYVGIERAVSLNVNGQVYTIQIKIPKGVRSGEQMRYNVIPNATLIVTFVVSSDRFVVSNTDLMLEHKVSLFDFVVGTTLDVTTISGKTLAVTVEPRTAPSAMLRIKGEGMPIPNSVSSYGDLYIKLTPVLPDIIDERIISAIIASKDSTSP